MTPGLTKTDDSEWGWLPKELVYHKNRRLRMGMVAERAGVSTRGTSALWSRPDLSMVPIATAFADDPEGARNGSSLSGPRRDLLLPDYLPHDLEYCPLCYDDAVLYPLPCQPQHRLCTICAYDPSDPRLKGCPWRCAPAVHTGRHSVLPPGSMDGLVAVGDNKDFASEYCTENFGLEHVPAGDSSASPSRSGDHAIPMRMLLMLWTQNGHTSSYE